jgi:hypothetical protein
MRKRRRSTLGQPAVGILLVLSSVSLAGCAALTVDSASEQQGTLVSATAPYANSIEEVRQRPLRPPGAAIVTCPSMAAHLDLQLVLSTGLDPGKPPPNGPFDGYGIGPVYLSGQGAYYPGGSDLAIWLVKPPYAGPLVIRGQQVNGTARVAFTRQLDDRGALIGPTPTATVPAFGESIPYYGELDLPAGGTPHHWRAYFARTHYGVAGCYFIQVDGTTFSETFLLEVPDAARPPA